MNQNELFTELQNNLNAATERQIELAGRYSNAWKMYRGELPERKKKGDLPADRVMWKAFESIYPSLVKLFTDNDKSPARFNSDGQATTKLAQAVTQAVHTAAMGVNNAYKIYMQALKEILITGNQAVAVGFDEKLYESDKATFDSAPLADIAIHQKLLEVSGYNIESELEFDEESGTGTGWIQGKRTIKYPIISLIDFKDFYLHPDALEVETAKYVAYTETLTVGEAVERGYSEDIVSKADRIDTSNGQGLSKALLVIDDMNGDYLSRSVDSVLSDANNDITVYHHFWRGCYNSKKIQLHYVVATDTAIIKHKTVDYIPVVLGGMSIATGSAWSESLYDMCGSVQISKTRALRAIQRSADGAAYGEHLFVEQSFTPQGKEAWTNRGPGGAYSVKSLTNAVEKLPVNDVPQAMELLNAEISQQEEAVIQGSAGKAQTLEENGQASGVAVALTQDKQELNESQIATCIAETFIKPMYRILLLVLQEMGNGLELDGHQIPLKMLRSDIGMSVDVETAYDRANAATNLLNMLNSGTQAQTLPANVTDQNRYEIYKLFAQAATGQKDVSAFITPPEDMPQPSKPEMMLKALMLVAHTRSQIAATELAEGKVNDLKADTQKKWNEAAKDLAQVAQIAAEIEMSKVELLLKYKQEQANEADAVVQNAQTQEQIDKESNQ